MGATVIESSDGNFLIEAKELVGNEIFLDIPSVGATINILLAAVKARGKTVIDNAAMEPEIVDVINFSKQEADKQNYQCGKHNTGNNSYGSFYTFRR